MPDREAGGLSGLGVAGLHALGAPSSRGGPELPGTWARVIKAEGCCPWGAWAESGGVALDGRPLQLCRTPLGPWLSPQEGQSLPSQKGFQDVKYHGIDKIIQIDR